MTPCRPRLSRLVNKAPLPAQTFNHWVMSKKFNVVPLPTRLESNLPFKAFHQLELSTCKAINQSDSVSALANTRWRQQYEQAKVGALLSSCYANNSVKRNCLFISSLLYLLNAMNCSNNATYTVFTIDTGSATSHFFHFSSQSLTA